MPKKILIVDDDSGVCHSFAMLLAGEGYSVDETTDSAEAESLVKRNRYDLCIFDYKMNGLHGLDLLLKTKAVNPQGAVFIISAMSNIEELCRKATDAGLVDGIIGKPFDVEALLKRIAAVIS